MYDHSGCQHDTPSLNKAYAWLSEAWIAGFGPLSITAPTRDQVLAGIGHYCNVPPRRWQITETPLRLWCGTLPQ